MIANLDTVIKATDPGAVGSFNILDLDSSTLVKELPEEAEKTGTTKPLDM